MIVVTCKIVCVVGLGEGVSIDSNAYGGVGSLVHPHARSDVSVTCYSLAEALDWSRQTFMSSATSQPAQVSTNFQLTKSPTHYYFFAMYMIKRFNFSRSKTNRMTDVHERVLIIRLLAQVQTVYF
jgi:hypothetical protein